jgi:hypothetical protein
LKRALNLSIQDSNLKNSKVDWTDIWVISIAIENGYIIVSHETKKTPYEKRWYIPDICSDYNIQHFRFLDIIKKEKWKFKEKLRFPNFKN